MSRQILRQSADARPWAAGLGRLPGQAAGRDGAGKGHRQPAAPLDPVEAARLEAAALLEQAHLDAEAIRAAAHEDGLTEGQEAGRQAVTEELERLAGLVEAVEGATAAFIEGQVPALAEVATAAAERIVREQLSLEPVRVVAIVRHALQQVPPPTRATVHLHPDDVETVRQGLAQRRTRKGSAPELVADPVIERGGCWIVSGQGEVDATVGGSLSRLQETVREALADARAAA